MQWTVNLFNVHTARLGIFTAAIQPDDRAEWRLEINGLTFRARWKTLDEAKAAAPALCKKHFQRALDAIETGGSGS